MSSFNLKKAKLENFGLTVEWIGSNDDQMRLACKDAPHPDLTKSFQKLESYVQQMFQLQEQPTVKGFILLKDKSGCVIISVIKDIIDNVSSLSTPVIRFEHAEYGFETECEKDVLDAAFEVYKYTKENKRAQLEVQFPYDKENDN